MKLALSIFCLLLASIFLIGNASYAGVVKTKNNLDRNYDIHYRVIIFNDLSSFQKNTKKQSLAKQYMISSSFDETISKPDNSLSQDKDREDILAKKKPDDISFATLSLAQEKQALNDFGELPVGSFLDDFKDDPKLRTVYFTSKDLIFSYKRKIANSMNLGLEENPDSLENLSRLNFNNKELPLTSGDEERLKQESKFLFGLISESYKTIIYVLLILFFHLQEKILRMEENGLYKNT